MEASQKFDIIIIGGSYAGLSAAMTLGRSLKNTLVIDSGKPCNVQTPHSHNFITQDGKAPAEIASIAKAQVMKYKTVTFYTGLASSGKRLEKGFKITIDNGDVFYADKLIFASGIKDLMPDIKGFADCWGITAIHCPYCHGYEVKGENTGIIGNGEYGFEFSKLISNWTKKLTLFTNGKSTLLNEQMELLKAHDITIIETQIEELEHSYGKIKNIIFTDGTKFSVSAIYSRQPFVQHCTIPEALGCELTTSGHLKINETQQTSVPGIFACGDSTTMMRSVASAVATGNFAAAVANREMIFENF